MPGLVVIAGDPSAEARARRAAVPTLRRPWERLSLAVRAGGSVVLGVAGERGGLASDESCAVAIDGELYAPPRIRSGDAAALELLASYRRGGTRLSPPEGSFTAAVWDDDRRMLLLITDHFGTRPLYVAREQETVLAAGELKALVAAGLTRTLDLAGVAEVLVYGEWVADATMLAGARRLPGATTLVFDRDGERELLRWRYLVDPATDSADLDEREVVREFGRLLGRAVSRMLDGTEALALSGGLDSRCVAAVLGESGFDGPAVTHATDDSRELTLAARAARAVGLRHEVLRLQPGYMARGAPACVWLSDGQKFPFSSHGLSFRTLRGEHGLRALLTGSRGDSTVRMEALPRTRARSDAGASGPSVHAVLARGVDARLDGILQPSFASELRGLAEVELERRIAADDGDAQALLAQINFRERGIASPALYDDHLAPRAAYEDVALAEFCARLPYRYRTEARLQQGFLRTYPRLARIPTWNEGVPATLPRRLGAPAQLAVRFVRRASTRCAARLPARWRRFPFLYFEDVLRAGGPALGVLLESRTLDRRQLRAESVARLVEETLRGRASHVRLLGRLLRVELFQRQFVDGDGAPEPL